MGWPAAFARPNLRWWLCCRCGFFRQGITIRASGIGSAYAVRRWLICGLRLGHSGIDWWQWCLIHRRAVRRLHASGFLGGPALTFQTFTFFAFALGF